MKTLTEYKKNRFTFELIKRDGKFAIFLGRKAGSSAANWEVIEIQSHNGMNMGGKDIPPAEYAPGNNQWGTKGWTFMRSEQAVEKMAGLKLEATTA